MSKTICAVLTKKKRNIYQVIYIKCIIKKKNVYDDVCAHSIVHTYIQ